MLAASERRPSHDLPRCHEISSYRLPSDMKSLTIDPKQEVAPARDFPSGKALAEQLPLPKEVNVHPSTSGGENASLFFVGTATTVLWAHWMASPPNTKDRANVLPGNGTGSA